MRCLGIGLLVAAPLCQSEPNCAWMNAATAEGIKGAVEIAATHGLACEFKRRDAPAYTLRIEVGSRRTAAGKCESNWVPLRGIGNEAMACADDGKGGERDARVVGRVREQQFVISIRTN